MCKKCEETDKKPVEEFKITFSKNHPRKVK